MPRSSSRRFPWIILLLVIVIGGGWYLWQGVGQSKAPPQMPPPTVSVLEVAPADIALTYEYAGRVAGSREVEIRPRVGGILLKRAYVEGQAVKEGDVLFLIDPEPYKAALADAQARFAQTEADWKRATALLKEKAVSPREFDEARSAYEQAKAQLQTAKLNVSYTTVTAPISGVTSKEGLSEGSLIAANSSLLTRISQMNPIYVNFAAADAETLTQRQQVASGALLLPEDNTLKAEIHFGDGSAYSELGSIDFTDSIIDPQTGTVSARAVVENLKGELLPGQFVRVVVKGFIKPKAVAIPDQAVLQGPQGPFVYTVTEESKAKITPVVLGALNSKDRLIEQGLNAGDKVIIEGMIKVRPDAPVNIAPKESAEKAAEKKE